VVDADPPSNLPKSALCVEAFDPTPPTSQRRSAVCHVMLDVSFLLLLLLRVQCIGMVLWVVTVRGS